MWVSSVNVRLITKLQMIDVLECKNLTYWPKAHTKAPARPHDCGTL